MTDQLTLEQSLQEIFPTLPAPVQRFIKDGRPEEAVQTIMDRYVLHIDQGGILERGIMLLLMGIENPDEFTQALVEEARLDQQTVNSIVQDVNAQIFVPLREEMRKGPPTEVKPPQAQGVAAQTPPRPAVLPQRTTIIPANPQFPSRPAQTPSITPKYVPPKKYFHLQNKIPPPPPRPSTQLRQGDDGQNKAGDVSLTYVNPAKLLEDHEEPHIDISEKVQVVSPETPLQQALRTVLPPPPNLPGAMPPKPSNLPPTPPSKPYSSDPYREPIDEK